MGERVAEIAGLNGAPARDAGVLVGRLNDSDLFCSLIDFAVFLFALRKAGRRKESSL